MSEKTLWNLDKELDKVGWDIDTKELGLSQTCLL
jgi:hypothetical protein